MIVRVAEERDIAWIVQETKDFARFYGSKRMVVDEEYAMKGFAQLMEDHVILVAESGTQLAGFIVGVLIAHPFNPSIRVLSEMLWWVARPFRASRAGYLLLKEYMRIGRERADWITMCSIVNSPINEVALERRGFRLMERNYLLEV